jgi:hypothetical protein
MAGRLLLRFGNLIADTVAEHQAILDVNPYVWWGWWAKEEESDLTTGAQADLRESLDDPIGLFNSDTGDAFVAICEAAVFGTTERPIPSPEPDATPAYYRNRSVRGWFKLLAIEPVGLPDFTQEFGELPRSRQTLFWGPKLLVSPDVEHRVLSSPVVLHVSDLHFGEDHGFGMAGRRAQANHLGPPTMLDQHLVNALRDRDPPIGVVVASGDLVTQGRDYWKDVSTFFNGLLTGLGLAPQRDLIVVPGNHDLWIDELRNDAYPIDNQNETAYRRWYTDFFEAPDRPIECFVRYEGHNRVLSFLQLNSARLRKAETIDYGFVGQEAYGSLLERIGPATAREIRIAVMHHHLREAGRPEQPREGRPASTTLDAVELIERLQESDFKLVMHGHKHEEAVQPGGRQNPESQNAAMASEGHLRPFWIVGCGSSGAHVSRLSEIRRQNCAMVYDFASSAQVFGECLEYTTLGRPRTRSTFRLPLYPWGAGSGLGGDAAAR